MLVCAGQCHTPYDPFRFDNVRDVPMSFIVGKGSVLDVGSSEAPSELGGESDLVTGGSEVGVEV